MEEVDSEKKSRIFPKGEIPSTSDQQLQSTEGSLKPGGWKVRKPLVTCPADRQRAESSSEGWAPLTWELANQIIAMEKHRNGEIQQGHGISQTKLKTQWVHNMILHSPLTFFTACRKGCFNRMSSYFFTVMGRCLKFTSFVQYLIFFLNQTNVKNMVLWQDIDFSSQILR